MLTLDSKRMTSKVSQERETDVEYEKEEKSKRQHGKKEVSVEIL